MVNLSVILGIILLVMFVLGAGLMVLLSKIAILYSLGFLLLVVSVASFLIFLIKKFT